MVIETQNQYEERYLFYDIVICIRIYFNSVELLSLVVSIKNSSLSAYVHMHIPTQSQSHPIPFRLGYKCIVCLYHTYGDPAWHLHMYYFLFEMFSIMVCTFIIGMVVLIISSHFNFFFISFLNGGKISKPLFFWICSLLVKYVKSQPYTSYRMYGD